MQGALDLVPPELKPLFTWMFRVIILLAWIAVLEALLVLTGLAAGVK